MDGNGRWARRHGLPRIRGHEKGGDVVQKVVQMCLNRGIRWLTLFAFSTENWGRPAPEVSALMEMLYNFLARHRAMMEEKDVRLRAIGELEMLPLRCRNLLSECVAETASHASLNLTLALSYGSRQEICTAAQRIAALLAAGKIQERDITPELISRQLYTANMPDPDLLIRTSGEMRLSNFLLWQISYAEIWVTPTLWPDFSENDFEQALADFAGRHRRYGKH